MNHSIKRFDRTRNEIDTKIRQFRIYFWNELHSKIHWKIEHLLVEKLNRGIYIQVELNYSRKIYEALNN